MACVDYPYPTSFIAPVPGNPVTVVCTDLVVNGGGSDLEVILGLVNMYVNYTVTLECMDLDSELVSNAGSASSPLRHSRTLLSSTDLGVTSWNYQACTELILEPITSDGYGFYPPDDGGDSDSAIEECGELFDVRTEPFWMGVSFGGGAGKGWSKATAM